jgi:hypothetical protein
MSQTIKNLLNQMYDSNPGLTRAKYDFSDPDDVLLIQHDAQHFIFGCDTSIQGELALQISVFLLSDASFQQLIAMYTSGESDYMSFVNGGIKSFKELGFFGGIKTICILIGHFVSCLWIKITTRQRFSFTKTHEYLEWTVADIRSKFNIKPFKI